MCVQTCVNMCAAVERHEWNGLWRLAVVVWDDGEDGQRDARDDDDGLMGRGQSHTRRGMFEHDAADQARNREC